MTSTTQKLSTTRRRNTTSVLACRSQGVIEDDLIERHQRVIRRIVKLVFYREGIKNHDLIEAAVLEANLYVADRLSNLNLSSHAFSNKLVLQRLARVFAVWAKNSAAAFIEAYDYDVVDERGDVASDEESREFAWLFDTPWPFPVLFAF